jgi:hypothetical protein
MTQNLRDTVPIWIAEKQSPWLSPYLAETLAALAHSRRVDQREQLFNIADDERVKKSLVRILKVAEKTVFMEWGRLARQRLHPSFKLIVEIPNVWWQQTVQVKYVAFVIGECCSFVHPRGVDQVKAGKRNQLRVHSNSPKSRI